MEKTITLSVNDRRILKSILPAEGGYIEMIVVNSISEKISFTPEETEAFEIKDVPDDGISFNRQMIKEQSFDFTREQIHVLKSIPKRLDKAKTIHKSMLPLLGVLKNL